jgi:hypothetical protein
MYEKTKTGYSAYADNFDKYPVSTTAKTLSALKLNMIRALNTGLEYKGMPLGVPE